MTLEDQLQGEWLCGFDKQCLKAAWLIDIRGRSCNVEGKVGTLEFVENEAFFNLGQGDHLVINRAWSDTPSDRAAEIPIIVASDGGEVQVGWMVRPGLNLR